MRVNKNERALVQDSRAISCRQIRMQQTLSEYREKLTSCKTEVSFSLVCPCTKHKADIDPKKRDEARSHQANVEPSQIV